MVRNTPFLSNVVQPQPLNVFYDNAYGKMLIFELQFVPVTPIMLPDRAHSLGFNNISIQFVFLHNIDFLPNKGYICDFFLIT